VLSTKNTIESLKYHSTEFIVEFGAIGIYFLMFYDQDSSVAKSKVFLAAFIFPLISLVRLYRSITRGLKKGT